MTGSSSLRAKLCQPRSWALPLLVLAAATTACGEDPPPYRVSPAVAEGVGTACTTNADCTGVGQECLPFKGGYCGIEGCTEDLDCPAGSACVTHSDNENYCFLLCVDKPDCNIHRPIADEANCVGSIDFVESGHQKACEPPEG